MYDRGLSIGKSNAKVEKIGKVTLQTIDVDKTFPGFGFVPRPGHAIELLHSDLGKKEKSLVTAGIMNTALTIRATDEANFSVHELIKFIQKKTPDSFVEGGGHKNAGSISFLPYKKEEVVELLREFIQNKR